MSYRTESERRSAQGCGLLIAVLGVFVVVVIVGALVHGLIGATVAGAVFLILMGALITWAAS